MDLPDFDALLPDPAARRGLDEDESALEAVLDAMTLVELVDWVRDNRLAREAFESDFADAIADYLADV
jgi:hypothetical protein